MYSYVVQHISSIPTYESHYSREKTQHRYLGPHLNKEKLSILYQEFCKENNIPEEQISPKWKYFDVFDKQFKLSFKPPEVDTCDTCDIFKARSKDNSLSQSEREKLTAEYDLHLNEAKKRYSLKSADTKMSKTNPKHRVLTEDLQKCLPTPLLTTGLSFYKRKLWTLNYTIYDSSDNSAHCMMWDESKGGRGGEEISSAIFKWADSVLPTADVNEITLWSDNCFRQNKNISIVLCFFFIIKKFPKIQCVNIKYLLKGHAHMEADTIHALIEKKRKSLEDLTIIIPWDWQQMVRQCSKKFHVYNMEQDDFLQFSVLCKGQYSPFVHRKTTVEKQKCFMSTCVNIQLNKDHIGKMYLKSSFEEEFQVVDLNRKKRSSARVNEVATTTFPPNLPTKKPVPISALKYNDLLSLLPFIPSCFHGFYKDLPKSNTNNTDYPASDNDSDSFDN